MAGIIETIGGLTYRDHVNKILRLPLRFNSCVHPFRGESFSQLFRSNVSQVALECHQDTFRIALWKTDNFQPSRARRARFGPCLDAELEVQY